jgi:photosystem II stability/assembly factor-like uncharacterized protein
MSAPRSALRRRAPAPRSTVSPLPPQRSRWQPWVIVALLAAAPIMAPAGVARWTPMEAPGGVPHVIALEALPDGTLLLTAGSSAEPGLFVSLDGGESWQQRVEAGTFPLSFYGAAVGYRYADDGRLLAGPGLYPMGNQVFHLLFESRDGGRTWASLDPGADPIGINAGEPGRWYGLSREEDESASGCAEGQRAILRSEDAGRHWQTGHCVPADVEMVAPVPGAPGELIGFSSDWRTSTFWSGDGGATRTPLDVDAVRMFAPGAGGPAFLWYNEGSKSALLRIGPGGPPYPTVFGPAAGSVPEIFGTPRAVAADPRTTGRWLLGTAAGRLFESLDDGRTWAPFGEPPAPGPFPQNPGTPVHQIVVTAQGRLVVAVDGQLEDRVLISDDDGRTWRQPESWPPAPARLRHVLLSDPFSGALYGQGVGGLVRSFDHGASWEPLGSELPKALFAPGSLVATDDAVFATEATGELLRTFRFDRRDEVWKSYHARHERSIVESRQGCPPEALRVEEYCSLDQGRSWQRIDNQGFDVHVSASGALFRFDPEEPSGISIRPPGATSWQQELPGVRVVLLALHPTDGEQALAVGEADGERRAWHRDAAGWRLGSPLEVCGEGSSGPWPFDTESALYNPGDPSWLYVAGTDCILFSRDGGTSWTRLDAGSSGSLIADHHDPRRLYHDVGHRILLTDAEPLRLGEEGRFEVTVAWKGPHGGTGAGRPQALTEDTGYFWFFDPDNVELVVKVLDGGAINQRYWVFYGALSNVEYEMTVADTALSSVSTRVAEYVNPAGTMASHGDTEALPRPPEIPSWSVAADRTLAGGEAIAATLPRPLAAASSPETLTLHGGRFEMTVEWQDFHGNAGTGTAQAITSDTGYFWFFAPDNVELVVKVLDGRPVNGRWWVFGGALSNVAYRLTVTDTATGETAVYDNPSGAFASFGDTAAFPRP